MSAMLLAHWHKKPDRKNNGSERGRTWKLLIIGVLLLFFITTQKQHTKLQ